MEPRVGAASDPSEPDQLEDEPDEPDESDEDDAAAPYHWYTVPAVQVALCAVVGGWLYQTYWMYRCWRAYRSSEGYSRAPFWRDVGQRTGYQVNPLWRAVLGYGYAFCLFPAVAREARTARLPGRTWPLLLAFAYNLSAAAALFAPSLQQLMLERVMQAAVLAAVQSTINRLANQKTSAPFAPVTSGQTLCVLVGAAISIMAITTTTGAH